MAGEVLKMNELNINKQRCKLKVLWFPASALLWTGKKNRHKPYALPLTARQYNFDILKNYPILALQMNKTNLYHHHFHTCSRARWK